MAHVSDHGLDGLTVAAVASRAGVAHTSVYRRWPTPADLVAAAFDDVAETANPTPDTGSLRSDLEVLAAQVAATLASPGAVRLLGAMTAIRTTDPITEARNRFWERRFSVSSAIVERAVARGELAPEVDAYAVIELLVAPLYFRTLVTGRPVDDNFLTRCAETVLARYDRMQ